MYRLLIITFSKSLPSHPTPMVVEYNSVAEAVHVFNELSKPDVSSNIGVKVIKLY